MGSSISQLTASYEVLLGLLSYNCILLALLFCLDEVILQRQVNFLWNGSG